MNIVLRYKDNEGIYQDIINAYGCLISGTALLITNAALTEAGNDFVKDLKITSWVEMGNNHQFSVFFTDEERAVNSTGSTSKITVSGPSEIGKNFNGQWTIVCIA